MFNLFKQLKTTVKAFKALTDYKFNILDKRIFNILHDEEFEMITTEFSELTWDGNTEGLTSVFVDGGGFYLIYDNPPTFEKASAGGRMIISVLQNGEMVDNVYEYTPEDVIMQNDNLYIILDCCVVVLDNNVEFQGIVFPKKGIYFASVNIPSQFVMCAKSLSINDYIFSSTGKVVTTPLKQIDKKYIPSGVADWNVNDPTASGYIINRTHWIENPKEVILIKNEKIVVDSVESEITPSFFVKLTLGQNYTVTFNDQIYECISHIVSGVVVIGNAYIMTRSTSMDTGEPFFMADLSSIGVNDTNFFMSSETGTHTITIKTIDSGIHKLDNKFLSNEIINVADAYKNEDLVTWDNMPEIYDDVIRYDTTQNLNNIQKSQAVLNLGLNDILRYSPQSLTDAQKTQVQTNLGISDTINNLHAVAKSGDYNDLENKPTYDLFTDSFGEDYLYGSNILFEENKINTEEIEAKIFEITDNTPIYEKISESTSEIVYQYFSRTDVSFLLNFYNKGVTSVRVIGIDSNPNNNFEFYATIDVKKVYVGNEEWTSCYIGDKNLNYRRTNYYGSTISIPKNPPIFIGSIFNSSSDQFLIAKSNTLKKVIINPENPKEIRENFIPNTIARKSDLKNIDLTGYATEDFVNEQINHLSNEKADYSYVDEKVSNVKVDLTGYATEEYVDSEIDDLKAQGVQQVPLFANSEDDMTDETKLYVLKETNEIWGFIKTKTEGSTVPNFTNLMDDPNSYIKDKQRYSHSGGAFTTSSATNECAVVVPIPSSAGGLTIRIRGTSVKASNYYNTSTYFGVNNQTFPGTGTSLTSTITTKDNGDIEVLVPNYPGGYNYMVQHVDAGTKKENLIVTVNEEITYTTTEGGIAYKWASTGHKFVPADYEDRILAVEDKADENADKISFLEDEINKSKASGILTMFISPNGDDNNDGLTESSPKKTVKACVDAGVSRISAKRGVYAEAISLINIGELEIFPTDNNKTYVTGEERQPIVFDTSDRIEVSALVAYNSIKRVAYNNTNSAYKQVFVDKTLAPIVSASQSSYHAALWLFSDDEKTVCRKPKPVLTVSECESQANTFCYSDGYIYINADMTGVTKIIVPTNATNGFYVKGADKLVLRDVEVRFSGEYTFDLRECAWVDLYKCSSKYTTRASGFHPVDTNGIFRACYAYKNFDGFAPNGHGHTTYIDCISEYNFDDGMSHHAASEGTVIGGRYEGNGKGGNIPAYGAKVNIYGGLYKNNAQYGICYAGDGAGNFASGIVQGAVMVDNPVGLEVQVECTVTALTCQYSGNTKDKQNTGTLVEY